MQNVEISGVVVRLCIWNKMTVKAGAWEPRSLGLSIRPPLPANQALQTSASSLSRAACS